MSRAGELVNRMSKLGTPGASPAFQEREPASANGRRQRASARAVHYTIDLDPELHRSLRIYALERRVDASAIIRALLELLDQDQVADLVDDRLDRAGT